MTTQRIAWRRLLVALDAATHAPDALDVVIELAHQLDTELAGLFVEDDNLVRSTELPFVRQVSRLTAGEESLDRSSTERELRASARRARAHLAAAAQRSQVSWSFRVVRGRVVREVMSAAEQTDLIVLPCARAPREAFLPGRGRPPAARGTRAVVVVLDDSPECPQVLDLAEQLVAGTIARIQVLIAAESPDLAATLTAQAREHFVRPGLALSCVRFWPPQMAVVRLAMEEAGGRSLLLLGASSSLAQSADMGSLLRAVGGTVLLVRARLSH
jgi:hypothetical protein